MVKYLDTPLFGIIISIFFFTLGQNIYKRSKSPFLNPLLLSYIAIISFLLVFNIDYEVYNKGGSIISFFLGPATVVLAIPLFKQINLLKENLIPILVGITIGSISGIVVLVILSRLLNLGDILMFSLIPKSTTTPIAIELSTELGGNPSLTTAFVVVTGIGGNIIGSYILQKFKIVNKIAKGIALGTASHAVGTARAIELGEEEGAMASSSIGVAGIITVFIAPVLLKIMGVI